MSRWHFHCTLEDLLIETPWFILVLFADAKDQSACRVITGYFFGFGPFEEKQRGYTQVRWKWTKEHIWRKVNLLDVFVGNCDRLGNPIR